MSLNSLIKKIIKEETEEWVDVSPEEYKELLDYVNGDGSFIKRLPDYAGKKIRITGELDLRGNKNVTNIDSVDLVEGDLDISYSSVSYFDKNKVRGRFDYWGSEMQRLEKLKIHKQRLAHQDVLRQDDYWNVENDDKGFDTFREWVWENHIDEDYVRRYLYDDYSEYVRQAPEDWNINKELTDQQKRYLEIHQANIDRLNQKLEDGGLTDEEQEEIESDIYDYQQLIDDINENPEGDYNEQEIEDTIEGMVDDNKDDIFNELKNRGYDNQDLLDFVDVDAAIDYVIRSDGYGSVLNSYDGTENEYTVNGNDYYVMRYN
jgi:hypothetical protein